MSSSSAAAGAPAELDVERAAVPTALLALDGRLLQVSASFADLVASTPEQLPGQPLHEVADDAEGCAALLRAVESAAAGQLAGEVRLPIRSRDRVLDVVMTWSQLRIADDAACVIRSLWVPEERVRWPVPEQSAGDARWQSLLHNAADITWTADADGLITSATKGVLEQLGWELHEVADSLAIDFIHPQDQPGFAAAWKRLVSRTSRQEVLECRVRRADGGWNWMRQTLTDLRDDPHVRSIVGNGVDITPWHEERQARARQEAHLRARFEQSLVPQATVGVHGRLVAANEALGALIGQPGSALIDQPIGRLAHPADAGLVDRAVADLLSGKREAAQAEGVLTGSARRPVPVLVDLSLFRDEARNPAGVALSWFDLTRLRDAEQRQRQQEEEEEFFLALNRRANDVAVVIDAEGTVLYVSASIQHMLGHDAASLLGASGWDAVHADDRAAAHDMLTRVVAGGSTEVVQVRARHASGTWRNVEATASNLLDTAVGGIVCNLVDVTDRVEAERALRASEARYRAIADTGGEGIWAISAQGTTLYVNVRMAEILGSRSSASTTATSPRSSGRSRQHDCGSGCPSA